MRTPVHRHDARVVNHLVQYRDVLVRLDELDVVVVHHRQHGRPGGRPLNTPYAQAQPEIFQRVGRTAFTPGLSERGRALLCLRCQRRYSPVRRIHDQGGSPVRQAFPLPPIWTGGVAGSGILPLEDLPLVCGRLFLRQDILVGQFPWSLERRHRGVVPDALEVRVAPGRAWRCPLPLTRVRSLGMGRQSCDDDRRRQKRQRRPGPNSHLKTPRRDSSVVGQDDVWILNRTRTVQEGLKDRAAPPVRECNADGRFVNAWGGSAQGYDWPNNEHGITPDSKDNVWIGGSGATSTPTPRSDDM